MFIQRCINCATEFDLDERIYVCSHCGDLLDIERVEPLAEGPDELRAIWSDRLKSSDAHDRSGVWRFREFLPFASDVQVVSLGEGNTPLYDAPRSAEYCGLTSLKLKHQGNNPTGSFKDTGMTVAVTQALSLRMHLVACASTGNTAASLAAYAARARMACAILVPEGQVSDAKLAQALDYGAKVLEIEGNFDVCMRVIKELAEQSSLYLVNSINSFRIEGQKTVAFELAEQLGWQSPDHLVVPGGNLGNSSAFGKGLREMLEHGLTRKQTRISVIQAEGAAPFARFYDSGQFVVEKQPHTLATAIKIGAPVSWKKASRAVNETGGCVITVSEQEIADAKATIGRDGIGCEPASATTVAGIRKLVIDGFIKKDERVVAVLTGHLLKDTDYVIKYHSQTLTTPDHKLIRGTFGNAITRVAARPCAIESALKNL
ncbi:MAG: threonine synthase [Acidobacteria bacterium]|nr:threonine synthase [Acidobacteriota bacterium]MCA1627640.1 threonine synthase [Acidobacteriota bacterium]